MGIVQLTGLMGESGRSLDGPDIIIQAVQFLALLGTIDMVISSALGSPENKEKYAEITKITNILF